MVASSASSVVGLAGVISTLAAPGAVLTQIDTVAVAVSPSLSFTPMVRVCLPAGSFESSTLLLCDTFAMPVASGWAAALVWMP